MLMPWRVNGTLDEAEAALFDAHLAECAECRAELASEAALGAGIASMPVPEFAERTRAAPLPAGARPAVRRRFLARRVPVGWALAGPAAAAAAVALFLALPPSAGRADDQYGLLGSSDPAAGNVIVMFAPDATERDLRAALEQAGGRIVDGPTASGAYVVQVGSAERPAALRRLRGADAVVLAEPIDTAGTP